MRVAWHCDGTLTRIHQALYAEARKLAGKEPTQQLLQSLIAKASRAQKRGRGSTPPAMLRLRKSKARSVIPPLTRLA
jgi:hypothetical protein